MFFLQPIHHSSDEITRATAEDMTEAFQIGGTLHGVSRTVIKRHFIIYKRNAVQMM